MARSDPAPLCPRQLRALLAVAGRQLSFGLGLVRDEVDRWRAEAWTVEDPATRALILAELERKRSYLDGAALFWTLAPRRDPNLLRLLVSVQVLANHLDGASEDDAEARQGAAAGWLVAIEDGVDLGRTEAQRAAGIYREGVGAPFRVALVDACRERCALLPGYARAHEIIALEARRGASMDLEHNPDRQERDQALRAFAVREFGSGTDMAWWELTAASSSLLTLLVALVLAAEGDARDADVRAAADAYRWVALLSALLDNYVDRPEDLRVGNHNYFDLYESDAAAFARLPVVCERALHAVGPLRDGARHRVVVAAMIAMFLSNENALSGRRRAGSRDLVARAGTLTRVLFPVLRAWRGLAGLPAE